MERSDRRKKRLDRQAERDAGVSGSQPEPIKSLKDLGRFKQPQTTIIPERAAGEDKKSAGESSRPEEIASDTAAAEVVPASVSDAVPNLSVDDTEGPQKPKREIPYSDAPGLSFRSGARAAALGRSGGKNEIPKLRRSDEDMEDIERLGDQWAEDRPGRWGEKTQKKYFAAGKRDGYAPLGKMGAAAPEDVKKTGGIEAQNTERDARVAAAIGEVEDRALNKGADPAIMFQLVGSALPENDRKLFIEQFGEKHDINGTKIENVPDISELGTTIEEVTGNLGSPDGSVGSIPFWRLPGDSAAVLSNAVVRRIAVDGVDKFGGKTYRWDSAAGFIIMSEDDIKKWRAAAPERARRMRTSAREVGPDVAPARGAEPTESSEPPAVLSADEYGNIDEERFFEGFGEGVLEKGKRTVGQAHAIFARMQHRDMPLANSYREAVQGLKDEDRREFEDNLFDAGVVPFALLATVIRDERAKHVRDRAVAPARSPERRRGAPTRERQAGPDDWQPPFGKGWDVVQ